jgi:acyl-CoA synthetase (AMP-forming)/AMP-acid ligase II
MTSLPGAILGMVAAHPEVAKLAGLRCIIYGGAPTPMGVLRKAGAALPPALSHAYGITETAGFVTNLKPLDHVFDGGEAVLARTASAGQATPLIDVRVVDDEGRDVPVGEVGEIVCGGPKIMTGYWRKPEATAAVLKDGWYHTGDMGTLDDEGYLSVVDRKKDMIISGGENVYPAEVENALYSHPKVADVAVIGVPDAKWGEAVKACVVVKRGEDLSEAELIAHARTLIAGYKCPKSVDFIEALPRNPSGKILRRELRAPYWVGKDRAVN